MIIDRDPGDETSPAAEALSALRACQAAMQEDSRAFALPVQMELADELADDEELVEISRAIAQLQLGGKP